MHYSKQALTGRQHDVNTRADVTGTSFGKVKFLLNDFFFLTSADADNHAPRSRYDVCWFKKRNETSRLSVCPRGGPGKQQWSLHSSPNSPGFASFT